MDRLVRRRKATRTAFTRALNKLKDLIEASEVDKIAVQVSFSVLGERSTELQELDAKILDLLLDEDEAEADLDNELAGAEDYYSKFVDMKVRASLIISQNSYDGSVDGANRHSERKFKLPKLELRTFGGDLKEWLPFWSQFRKIDQDVDIAPEDKFQYLIQSTSRGSRAREVVESFPPTAENYSKAVSSLKSRFGREDLLVEVYVREVLKLILSTHQSKGSIVLSSLYDKLESYLRALETLGVTTEKCSAMLFPLIESCFPEEFLKAWHRSAGRGEMKEAKERLSSLMEFLKTEVEGEERITLALAGFGLGSSEAKASAKKKSDHRYHTTSQEDIPSAAGLLSTTDVREAKKTCVFCDKSHSSSDCFTAQGMSIAEKQKVLRQRGCCFSCLKPGHVTKKCRAVLRCCVCWKHHVTLMCEELKPPPDTTDKSDFENVTLTNLSNNPKVFLQTLRVKIASDCQEACVRALIDTGSQKSYILKDIAEKMKYVPQREESVIHSLFGGISSNSRKHHCYKIRLGNLDGSFSCNFMVLDQPMICQGISSVGNGPWMTELKKRNISLTDVGRTDEPIVILIGADVAGRLLTGRREELTSGLVALETRLGWTLMGKVPQSEINDPNVAMMVTSLFIKEADVSDLWRLDLIGITETAEKKSKAEQEFSTRQHFLETVKFNEQGRYEVRLPWLEGHPPLHDNKDLAMKRLNKTSKKLESDNLYTEYDNVLQQWLSEGIIEEVPKEETLNCYFLPHRPVVKESSSTTRIRPVFDASARSHNQCSLNQCLDSGPNLIELIPDVLLRFRKKRFGVIADIKKAFLQISVNKEDRNFLCFLWWDKDRNSIKMFRHTRVVFGVTCSPFLLGAVIEYHIRRTSVLDTDTVQQLIRSFYVDNLVTSKDSEDELRQFISETTELMAEGGFELRGWETSQKGKYGSPSPVLGIAWDKESDTLQLNLSWIKIVSVKSVTRRTILSIAHRLFDPVGATSPVMVCPKILLQRTWQLAIHWDTEVTNELKEEFLKWFDELHLLSEVEIPRWLGTTPYNMRSCTIHTFCDASSKAYAAVTFLRIDTDADVVVRLLAARSRVAPLKNITIPRMELLAALIGSRLANSVVAGLLWRGVKMYFWSDSTTVLAWILREEKWSVFVRNRIQEIRTLCHPTTWGHVAGEENPADLPSRGCGARQLVAERWWEGPAWMRQPIGAWPCSSPDFPVYDEQAVLKEKMKTTCLLTLNEQERDWYYRRFSSYTKIVRLVAWILRFIRNCLCSKNERIYGEITSQDYCAAEKKIAIQIQKESFSDENDEKLKTLDTFKDTDGIIRVRTKLVFRKDKEDFKRPVILPSKHEVVRRLIFSHHELNNHAGVGTLMSILRERYWILNGRKSIRSVISRCVVCRRYSSKRLETVPAPLPEPRIRDAAVFEVTGLDMAGPLFLKNNEKAWVCLFTCAVYRAVHLELVTSLSTESFLLALRRFVARRGRCSIIYSDNGTNFVGAVNKLKSLDWSLIVKRSTAHHIEWRFNPPTAAWWGGWWERIIRILKDLLKRVLGKACLNYEEMTTTLCDCESIINSRPLTYIAENDSELVPLSPALFLQDIKEIGVLDFDEVEHRNLNRRVRYRQSLQKDLRRRFRSEYLGQLVQRAKSKKGSQPAVSAGEIVLIGSDSLKRLHWPLGRVTEIIPGRDGVVRVVKLQTANGELTRPVQRLYPLEVSTSDDLRKSFVEGFHPGFPRQEEVVNRDIGETRRNEQKVFGYRTRDRRLVKAPERLNL